MPEGYDPTTALSSSASALVVGDDDGGGTSAMTSSKGSLSPNGEMSLKDIRLDFGSSLKTTGETGRAGSGSKSGGGGGGRKLGGGFDEYQDGDLDPSDDLSTHVGSREPIGIPEKASGRKKDLKQIKAAKKKTKLVPERTEDHTVGREDQKEENEEEKVEAESSQRLPSTSTFSRTSPSPLSSPPSPPPVAVATAEESEGVVVTKVVKKKKKKTKPTV